MVNYIWKQGRCNLSPENLSKEGVIEEQQKYILKIERELINAEADTELARKELVKERELVLTETLARCGAQRRLSIRKKEYRTLLNTTWELCDMLHTLENRIQRAVDRNKLLAKDISRLRYERDASRNSVDYLMECSGRLRSVAAASPQDIEYLKSEVARFQALYKEQQQHNADLRRKIANVEQPGTSSPANDASCSVGGRKEKNGFNEGPVYRSSMAFMKAGYGK